MRLVGAAGGSTHIPRRVLGAVASSPDLSAGNCKMGITKRGPCEKSGENEEREEEAAAAAGRFAGVPEAEKCSDVDSDSDLETEGTHGLGELVRETLYLRSCRVHSVVPASCFLRQGSDPELNLRHRGLGPQGAQALASSLNSNPYVKRLDLRDNGLCGAGTEALASALSKSSCICDVDLSENQLGAVGAQAICAALIANPTMQKVQLAGNGLEEQAAQYLAELLLAHTGLKSLDLSYNQLNDQAGSLPRARLACISTSAPMLPVPLHIHSFLCLLSTVQPDMHGKTLGPALAENTGLIELNISWNHLRGPGAIAFASGLEANIFLRVLDISYNGFGDPGASAVGEALRTNNVLEELNVSNNRISAVGALSLGRGLRVNQTLRSLVVSRNPMQNKGCLGVLKSVQDNPVSALELLDFSEIQVNREFDDLASSVKAVLPGLCIKTAAHRVEYKKMLLPVFRSSLPASAPK